MSRHRDPGGAGLIVSPTKTLVQRTWVYAQRPLHFGVAPCSCGATNCAWSEWKDRLWCYRCKKDFVPEHWGLLDGPVAVNCAAGLGIDLRRVSLKTRKIMRER